MNVRLIERGVPCPRSEEWTDEEERGKGRWANSTSNKWLAGVCSPAVCWMCSELETAMSLCLICGRRWKANICWAPGR